MAIIKASVQKIGRRKPIDEHQRKCTAAKVLCRSWSTTNLSFEIASSIWIGHQETSVQPMMQCNLDQEILKSYRRPNLVANWVTLWHLSNRNQTRVNVSVTNGLFLIGEYGNMRDLGIVGRNALPTTVDDGCGWMYIGPQGIVHGTFNSSQCDR